MRVGRGSLGSSSMDVEGMAVYLVWLWNSVVVTVKETVIQLICFYSPR